MSEPLPFTEEEYRALRLVRARSRMDRGDLQAMLRIISRTEAEVIPLIEAINLEVEPRR